jgi:hypothetical protein
VQHSGKNFVFFLKKLFPECLSQALREDRRQFFLQTLFPECRCPGTRGSHLFLQELNEFTIHSI